MIIGPVYIGGCALDHIFGLGLDAVTVSISFPLCTDVVLPNSSQNRTDSLALLSDCLAVLWFQNSLQENIAADVAGHCGHHFVTGHQRSHDKQIADKHVDLHPSGE